MVRERAWNLESKDQDYAFLPVFNLVQDNYYCLNNNNN